MKKKLKLFVWRDVLCDYTCGLIAAIAHDEDEARDTIMGNAMQWEWEELSRAMDEPPEIYDTPYGVHVWGS